MTAGSHALLRQGPAEWGLLLLLVALWGSSFMLVRVSLDAFTPAAVRPPGLFR